MINELLIVDGKVKLDTKNIYLYGDIQGVEEFINSFKKYGLRICAVTWDSGESDYPVFIPKERFFNLIDNDKNNQLIISLSNGKTYEYILDYALKGKCDVCSAYAALLYADIFLCQQNSITDSLEKFYRAYNRFKSTCHKLINALDEDCILVYQRCKVGSSTICNSLNNIGIKNVHVHQLNFSKPNKFFDCRLPIPKSNIEIFNGDLQFNKSYITKLRSRKKLKIITSVRNPISRDYSEFFQALDWPAFERYRIREEGLSFLTACLTYMQETAKITQSDWFDTQIKELFDVDVFDYSFDKDKGYSIIKQDNVEIFIFKLECLSNIERELSDFVGNSDFKLINANTVKEKQSAVLYKTVREALHLSDELVNVYLSQLPRMTHFYSVEEMKKFFSEWNISLDSL